MYHCRLLAVKRKAFSHQASTIQIHRDFQTCSRVKFSERNLDISVFSFADFCSFT
jgi:hypothetical protein